MRMNEMLYALTDFCVEQDETESVYDDTAAEMIGGLLDYCDERLDHTGIVTRKIGRYDIITDGRECRSIVPDEVREDGVLCDSGVILCYIESKNTRLSDNVVSSGYEVVYDYDENVVRVFYKIKMRGEDVLTVYRTEMDHIENYNFYAFYGELSSQLNGAIDSAVSK